MASLPEGPGTAQVRLRAYRRPSDRRCRSEERRSAALSRSWCAGLAGQRTCAVASKPSRTISRPCQSRPLQHSFNLTPYVNIDSSVKGLALKEISELRFNAIAGYARHPRAVLTGEELAYYEAEDGSILGLLIRDRTDGDFAGMAFGRDAKLRFRWTSMTNFLESPELAHDALAELMTNLLDEPDEFHHQGDERGSRSISSLLCTHWMSCTRTSSRSHPKLGSFLPGA